MPTMQVPDAPTHEAERLSDVRALNILDTPPDQRFDRIVNLASAIFDLPIAYIAVIDEKRQWFKSEVGLDAVSTRRDRSFCGHTILEDKPLVIPDASEDERFCDNPMVTNEPYIRFYAGYPLKGPTGHNVATLCLADTKRRAFHDGDHKVFAHLAALAEHELNMVDLIGEQKLLIDMRKQLRTAQRKLERELNDAAAYVRSLLPAKLDKHDGHIRTDYRFISSSRLGGDLFGYHWLDQDHLAIYLLDVTGHGLAASLLSASVGSCLARSGLLEADLHDPGEVLTALNRSFPMQQNNDKFFTIWYGVYNHPARTLQYATGGHPPAIAFTPDDLAPRELGEPSYMIGVEQDVRYRTLTQPLPPATRLYLFSDGAFEIRNPDGQMLRLRGFIDLLTHQPAQGHTRIDHVLAQIRRWQNDHEFPDDLSLLELQFG